jgi:acetyl-CoA synthetase
MAGDVGSGGLSLLRKAAVPVIEEPRAAIAALAGLARIAQGDEAGVESPASHLSVREFVFGREFDGILSEHASKSLLGELGVPVVEGSLVTTAAEAIALANSIGYPVVVKISSAQIPHKSEIGGLRTGISNDQGLVDALEAVISAGRSVAGATIEGARVERQVSGLELIVGAVREPTFGPMVLVGLGGVLAEALNDVVMAPAPISVRQARRMLSRLRGRRVLTHPRSGDPPDQNALAALIVRVGEILSGSTLEEIEINPLIWSGSSWLAVDALVRAPAGSPS